MSKIMNIPKQLPKEAEGGQYNIGDEIEVTPQELEMLKQQGYKFKITG